MRTSILAVIAVAGSAVAFPAIAQERPGPQQAAPSQETSKQMHQDVDATLKGQANEQIYSGALGYRPPRTQELAQAAGLERRRNLFEIDVRHQNGRPICLHFVKQKDLTRVKNGCRRICA